MARHLEPAERRVYHSLLIGYEICLAMELRWRALPAGSAKSTLSNATTLTYSATEISMYNVVYIKVVESRRHLGQKHDYGTLFALSVKDELLQIGKLRCDLTNRRLNYIKIISVKVFQLKQLKKETWKFQAWTGIEPVISAIPVQRSEVMGSIPVQARIFSGFFFSTA